MGIHAYCTSLLANHHWGITYSRGSHRDKVTGIKRVNVPSTNRGMLYNVITFLTLFQINACIQCVCMVSTAALPCFMAGILDMQGQRFTKYLVGSIILNDQLTSNT
ncbi:hypothetical protein XELAEV_18004914mg [Xenopus laevis]|uniref:Uncharacterized protein n=1 Tax=Xenopus laevis TaxID=8355 RepID=A0A974I2P7_XENLA|nr:hypothetical protein XELAEV_18004914mg [Xenopus laevis]